MIQWGNGGLHRIPLSDTGDNLNMEYSNGKDPKWVPDPATRR